MQDQEQGSKELDHQASEIKDLPVPAAGDYRDFRLRGSLQDLADADVAFYREQGRFYLVKNRFGMSGQEVGLEEFLELCRGCKVVGLETL